MSRLAGDRLQLGEIELETATEAIPRRTFEAFELKIADNRHTTATGAR